MEDLEEKAWDSGMERDFLAGGRGHPLLKMVTQDIDKGRFTPLDEGLRSPQKRH